jgi:hypothetical protein
MFKARRELGGATVKAEQNMQLEEENITDYDIYNNRFSAQMPNQTLQLEPKSAGVARADSVRQKTHLLLETASFPSSQANSETND